MADEPSRLQRKIAAEREELARDIEPGWEDLWSAVQQTCNTMEGAYGEKGRCVPRLNEHNSRITVIPAPITGSEDMLELRLDRDAKKVIAKVAFAYQRTGKSVGAQRTYQVVPCLTTKSLCFSNGRDLLSATEAAEQEIVVHLLKMSLPEKD